MMLQKLKKNIVSFGLTLTFMMALVLGGSATAMAQHRDYDRDDHRRWEHRDDRNRWERQRRDRVERQWRYRTNSQRRMTGYYDRFGRFHATGYYDVFGRLHRY
jgi:hypothetical protein